MTAELPRKLSPNEVLGWMVALVTAALLFEWMNIANSIVEPGRVSESGASLIALVADLVIAIVGVVLGVRGLPRSQGLRKWAIASCVVLLFVPQAFELIRAIRAAVSSVH
jgi:hypothetical protein